MYKKIIRPLLFELSPELIHRIVVVMLRVVHYVPGARQLLRTCFTVRIRRSSARCSASNSRTRSASPPDSTRTPRCTTSCCRWASVLPKWGPSRPKDSRQSAAAAFPPAARRGADQPDGLQQPGHGECRAQSPPPQAPSGNRRKPGQEHGDSERIGPADYLKLFRSLYQYVDYFVINVSCPNVRNLTHLQDKETLKEILRGLLDFRRGQNQYRPILLKISPDLTDRPARRREPP